ncbi:MAG TPA: hypothetical protein H9853_09705 [Candidatus Sphingobacterium stercoripullorum]|uniref:Uncharacterized protein n=1 Tax=Candidatus Sphingobacterium stercoripullorum TaxID=2838759 RepID=A0A9D1WA40_9SPHI|nr:hypothetical protein [Candidatus Sphingobacterium stercoripullorum]
MEKLLPILIFVAIYGYQTYKNFQKEQEKAKGRNIPRKRPQATTQAERRQPAPTPRPVQHREVPFERTPYEELTRDQSFEQPSKPKRIALKKSSELAESLKEKNKKLNKQPEQKLVLEILEDETQDEEVLVDPVLTAEEFDLKRAVIHQTILERPTY